MWELIIGMPISLTIINEEDKGQTEVILQSKNEINFLKGLEEIGLCAFACTNLSSVNLPEDTDCGEYFFGGCKNLRDISLPKNMTQIPN